MSVVTAKFVDTYPHQIPASVDTDGVVTPARTVVLANYVIIDGDIDGYSADNALQDKPTKPYSSNIDPDHPDTGKPRWVSLNGHIGDTIYLDRKPAKKDGIPTGKFRWFFDDMDEKAFVQDLEKALPETRQVYAVDQLADLRAKRNATKSASNAMRASAIAKLNAAKVAKSANVNADITES